MKNKLSLLITVPVLLASVKALAVPQTGAPEEWNGYYKGQCELSSPKRGVFYAFPMALEINDVTKKKADWIITYGEGEAQQVRNYSLLTIDSDLGHYAVDENNGIVIDQYLIGNEFMSLFEVASTKIQTTYTLDSNGTMDVSMESFTFDPVRENNVGSYTVSSYALKTKQKCRLYKW
ncbi:hypothetical protein [Pseudoalteromonas byunsanensis]|uniref:Uncharacterized protein n=1 Tax=Pseudoalteromonas byunsanensis TaxID=327939 RepID=A0A1S1N965_9GAMM|nr:hypothetical protein [Pseudoalteromonas byunsanensis]OHU96569.1 hypothetical protein BIW53_04365 [Pseudoalteromonas byunsanensis]